MTMQTLTRTDAHYPQPLTKMHKPPDSLYAAGNLTELLARPRVAIVGSRQMTPYGRQVTAQLAKQLVAAGVVIVSGLALGVDACAHTAVVQAGGQGIAVLPTPLNAIHPTSNRPLAQALLQNGGALVSSYAPGSESYKGNFVARNEIVAALSDAVIITEATSNSGSRHTAQFALDMGVPVFAVPGNITSAQSAGTNQLLKVPTANVLTEVTDILHALQLSVSSPVSQQGSTPAETVVLNLIAQGVQDGAYILEQSHLGTAEYNQTLTMLEITGKVQALGGNQWGLA